MGTRIRSLRKERKMTLEELAAECEMTRNGLSLVERGESNPRLSTLYRIACALGVSLVDLLS
nr:helix-turn-helix transcriptional regulator [Rubrobacter calidifluminis]